MPSKQRNRFIFPLLLFGIVHPNLSSSQSITQIEHKIKKSLALIDKYWLSRWNEDPLSEVSQNLRSYLLRTLPKIPASMSADIKVPSTMSIVTSADKKLRQWSWDTGLGGSMPEIYILLEYATLNGIKVIDPSDPNALGNTPDWFDTIYTVTSKSGHNYYLPVINSKYSGRDVASRIEAYSIEGNALNRKVKLFQTPKKQLHSISINYDFFKSYDETVSGVNNKIHLSSDLKTLFIPVVEEDSLTSGTLQYEFDGEHFVFKRVVK